MENLEYELLSTDQLQVDIVVQFVTGFVFFRLQRPNDDNFVPLLNHNLKNLIKNAPITAEEKDWLFDFFFGDKGSPQQDDFSKY